MKVAIEGPVGVKASSLRECRVEKAGSRGRRGRQGRRLFFQLTNCIFDLIITTPPPPPTVQVNFDDVYIVNTILFLPKPLHRNTGKFECGRVLNFFTKRLVVAFLLSIIDSSKIF